MPFYGGSAAAGYTDALDAMARRRALESGTALNEAQLPLRQIQARAAQRGEAARPMASQTLGQLYPAPGGELPPPPGAQRGPLPPGVGQASVPGAPPAAGPAPQAPVTPYQALPTPPSAGPDMGMGTEAPEGEIAAPPALDPQTAQRAQAEAKSLEQIVQAMRSVGVPPEKMLDVLETLEPSMTSETKRELAIFKAHTTALSAATKTYSDIIRAQAAALNAKSGARRAATGEAEAESRAADRVERQRIARDRINQAMGGADNVKRSTPVHDADGTQIGWNVLTKSGRSIQFDMEGERLTGPRAGAGPKADVNRVRNVNALRGELATLTNIELTQSGPERAKTRARMTAIQRQLEQLNVPPARAGSGGAENESQLEQKALQAWGGYDTTKYDYRIGPGGEVQRKAKGR